MIDTNWQTTAQELIRLALREDLGDHGDVTTAALISADQVAGVQIVSRGEGVLAGLSVARMVFDNIDPAVKFDQWTHDGDALAAGQIVADLSGKLKSLLIGERTCLNFLTHLSGVATLTRRFVDAVAGTRAGIFDTRKTLPGWRTLEKQAVAAGGGKNHRMGLYDMVLIKDNHLAGWQANGGQTIASAVRKAREISSSGMPIEVEVDTLEQLADALDGRPDIVLLDNMTIDGLHQAVKLRDERAPEVELEASGGVSLATVAEIARTGVERISVGALTHSPLALDLAFDWKL
ncbi:MAG TPA: carboxylating nicotinate-nucleotide diphosphorylase [Planctomycetaceae bacterium]|jgi:nicotinate-nucleotide pyrophosphorylase (carboxylating)